MTIFVTSTHNQEQTLDSVALPPYATQERASATAEIIAAAAGKLLYYSDKKGDAPRNETSYSYSQATGTTVAVPDDAEVVNLTHGSTIAALTVNPPANPRDGQKLTISSTSAVTALTMTALGSQTIVGAMTALTAGGFGTWMYNKATKTWRRVA